MQINENVLLAPYSTFYIGGPSRYLIYAQDTEEIIEAVKFAQEKNLDILVFGGGSNLLIADKGFDGVAIRIETVGIDIVSDLDNEIVLKIASGEVWDDVVRFACEENWWGIENLSHIPGFTGAFAVQNVGAYGQEASDVITEVEVFDTLAGQIRTLPASELSFGYRKSIFNSTQKNRYVILRTTIKLSKVPKPNLSYGDLAKRFSDTTPAIGDIRNAVIEVRNTKFPFPSEPTKGNSGSFFRGKILSQTEFDSLAKQIVENFGDEYQARLQEMKSRLKVSQGYKTPTAFLIELCVGKDLSLGGATLNPGQPAIIINQTGQATASEIIELFRTVQSLVKDQSGVVLEAEPELIGFTEPEIAGMK